MDLSDAQRWIAVLVGGALRLCNGALVGDVTATITQRVENTVVGGTMTIECPTHFGRLVARRAAFLFAHQAAPPTGRSSVARSAASTLSSRGPTRTALIRPWAT